MFLSLYYENQEHYNNVTFIALLPTQYSLPTRPLIDKCSQSQCCGSGSSRIGLILHDPDGIILPDLDRHQGPADPEVDRIWS